MYYKLLLKCCLFFLPLVPASATAQYSQQDIDSGKALAELSKIAHDNAISRLERGGSSTCNKNNVKVYKEWYILCHADDM